MLQYVLIAIVVLVAAGWLVRHLVRALQGRSCAGCSKRDTCSSDKGNPGSNDG